MTLLIHDSSKCAVQYRHGDSWIVWEKTKKKRNPDASLTGTRVLLVVGQGPLDQGPYFLTGRIFPIEDLLNRSVLRCKAAAYSPVP